MEVKNFTFNRLKSLELIENKCTLIINFGVGLIWSYLFVGNFIAFLLETLFEGYILAFAWNLNDSQNWIFWLKYLSWRSKI